MTPFQALLREATRGRRNTRFPGEDEFRRLIWDELVAELKKQDAERLARILYPGRKAGVADGDA